MTDTLTTTTTPDPLDRNGWLELRVFGEMFDDALRAKNATANRVRSSTVDPAIYDAQLETMRAAKDVCGKALVGCYKRVVPDPIQEWQEAMPGVGPHLLARLLGQIGHPRWATPHHWKGTGAGRHLVADPPFERSVGQLWQYCGHGSPARRAKGMTAADLAAQGNPRAKMLVHLIAEGATKESGRRVAELLDGDQDSADATWPYRVVYENARLDVADKTHTAECVRCGPSGKPAQPGDPWSKGHQMAHALRIVGKELLRDLWIVAGRA